MDMGKRKRKRRKDIAMSAFGLGGMADHYEANPLYQRKFQASDMAWLADEYQRRCDLEPAPTLEEFAAQYGVSADELRFHIPKESGGIDSTIVLWHGTTKSRAESIRDQGFRLKRARHERRIFFAAKPDMARGVAQRRASLEGDLPAVIRCCIDLSYYYLYERRKNIVYTFAHDYISSDVIKEINSAPTQRHEKRQKQEKQKDTSAELTNVVITFNSGRAGIAYWLSNFLNLTGEDQIQEDHESVEKIKGWLDAESDAGRFGMVPDDEILNQVQ